MPLQESRPPAPRMGGGRSLVRTISLGFILLLVAAGCGGEPRGEGSAMTVEDASRVLDRHSAELMAIPGVIGVYVGARSDSSLCIRVILLENRPEARPSIPEELEGVPVEIEESDAIRPM